MKRSVFLLLAVATAVIAACSSQSGRSTDPELAAAVRARLESRRYAIYFDHASPNAAIFSRFPRATDKLMNLTSDYNIRISGDSIHSYLPYFGEAYTATMGRQDGLNFDAPITRYKVSSRKGFTEIKFDTRTFEDNYEYTLSVYPNGQSYLIVNPDRKSSISFDGMLKLED